MTNIVSTHKKDKWITLTILIKKSSTTPIVYFLISVMIFLLSAWTVTNTNAQTDKDPAFQDSYWTDNNEISSSDTTNTNVPLKKEVAPGEGAATLAIVLVNKARSDITAVKGYLSLPSGFKTIGILPQDIRNNISNSSQY